MQGNPVKLPVIELVKKSDLASDKTTVTPNKTSSIYGLSFGMLVGGSIIAGIWLIARMALSPAKTFMTVGLSRGF